MVGSGGKKMIDDISREILTFRLIFGLFAAQLSFSIKLLVLAEHSGIVSECPTWATFLDQGYVQSGASYLSQDFVMFFHVISKGSR